MSEITKYEAYKKKLEGVCDENNLVFRFRYDGYPITLTIRPIGGMENQMSMLESADNASYISPDAAITFVFKDGDLTYKMSETFTISDALFAKVRNLFKNMHSLWLQFFFRDVLEKNLLSSANLPKIEGEASASGDASDDDPEDDPDDDIDGAIPLEIDEDEIPDFPPLDDEDEPERESTDSPGETKSAKEAEDPYLQEAINIVRREGRASVSMLQKQLSIGYSKASHLIDELEALGIIGPKHGAASREVLPFDEPAPDYDYERSEADDGSEA